MAYPFGWIPIPFWAFRALLESKFQCQYRTLDNCVAVDLDDGTKFTTKYLERSLNGKVLQYALNDLEDDDLLWPSQIRRICRRLEIDPRDLNIGLHLG